MTGGSALDRRMGCAALLLAVHGLLAFASAAWAGSAVELEGPHVLVIDPAKSRIAINLKATLHEVDGTFALLGPAELRFDLGSGAASGALVVDARSGDTANEDRDAHMHERVLLTEAHPKIVFHAASIEPVTTGDRRRVRLRGELELLGARHPMDVEAFVDGTVENVRVEGKFVVPYVEWGLERPGNFLLRVAKTVDVVVALEGRIEPAPPAP